MLTRAVLAAIALAALATAAAADDRDAAEAHARRGVALYNLGKYGAAISEFEQAYTLYQSDALLFDLGQAHRQLDHCEQALLYYRRFLSGAPRPELARDVRRLVPKLEAACEAKREQPDGADAAPREDVVGPDALAVLPPPPAIMNGGMRVAATAAPDDGAAVAAGAGYGATAGAAAGAGAGADAAVESDNDTDVAAAAGPPSPRSLAVVAAVSGGAVIGGRAAPSTGLIAAIAVPRTWRGADVTVGVAADLRVIAWSDGLAAGTAPVGSVVVELARRYSTHGGAIDVEVGGSAGVLVVGGLGQRGHPLATTRARGTEVLPGGRFELGIARRFGGSRFELWTGARIGVWPSLGGVSGTAVVELDAIAGFRVRP